MLPLLNDSVIDALLSAQLEDAFRYLGFHSDGKQACVNVFMPGATSVSILDRSGESVTEMQILHQAGIFSCAVPVDLMDYQVKVEQDSHLMCIEDPYRFPSLLQADEVWLFTEGRAEHAHRLLGARPVWHDGIEGVQFSVWAPNAKRVAVVGDFNFFDARTHVLRFHPGCGIWEMFVPGPVAGNTYRFDIIGNDNGRYKKADPYAREMLTPSDSVAVVTDASYKWQDDKWMAGRMRQGVDDEAISIYEVHAGSWKRDIEGAAFDYDALGEELLDYVSDMGFTHVQFMPLSEHPFTGSWGYQPIGLFAPTTRHGSSNELKKFIDRAHKRGIGVLLDWVPAHFPNDAHGLVRFDGTALYEHEDKRKGEHPDWGTLIYNYGRAEVISFLVSNALYWVEEFHIDGLRVDAVASMLYLDYSREAGEWMPNEYGGRENLQAIDLLRRMNEAIHSRYPGVLTIAEESTAWPGVTKSESEGGLGFTLKWNMGWMHDTLGFIQREPIHRNHHHNEITFSMVYAYSEHYALPFSHDEVVHGKHSLLNKMPGDRWQQFANLRTLFAYMWAHPGKKHLFMGCEFGESAEWNHDGELNWSLLDHDEHRGLQQLVRDLNCLYQDNPALYAGDNDPALFEWRIADDTTNSVLAFERFDPTTNQNFLVVINFTPVVRYGYEVPVNCVGGFKEVLNTDSEFYGGSNVGNQGQIETRPSKVGHRLTLTLPPLATVMLLRVR